MDIFTLRTVLHRDLLDRTLERVVPDHRTFAKDQSQRLTEGYADGLSRLRRLLGEDGVEEEVLRACWTLANEDPRFGFLHSLPSSAAFGAWSATAVGEAFFGSSDPESIDVATLLNTSITLVDGLLDEAPHAFHRGGERIRDLLQRHLCDSGGASSANLGEELADSKKNDHPVLTLTLAVVRGWTSRLASATEVSRDSGFLEYFREAAISALDAELTSAKLAPIGGEVDLASCATTLVDKSANALWLTAMAGFTGRGFPSGKDPSEIARAFRQLGVYFGWVDDLVDLLVDLDAGRWNLAHFEILEASPEWHCLEDLDIAFWISASLADNSVLNRLIDATAQELDRARSLLYEVTLTPKSLENLIRDATCDWCVSSGLER